MEFSVTAEDRILLLTLEDTTALRELATAYAVVGMGTAEEVRAARRACADLPNFMFVQGNRDEIPWQDRWFTYILVRENTELTPSMARVLAEGGRVIQLP
ncbi:hypothetical protein [uncultured Paludibaculum sp.]|uniref:hypothetical protein n=1 Tax=uncultured Paludibaculum sp. TaxID=1765020 RepID=UPI002AAB0B46|nr:hypothetical protein [uncultured Paludibaculum sp.]